MGWIDVFHGQMEFMESLVVKKYKTFTKIWVKKNCLAKFTQVLIGSFFHKTQQLECITSKRQSAGWISS